MNPQLLVIGEKYRVRDQNTNMTHECIYKGKMGIVVPGVNVQSHVFFDLNIATAFVYTDTEIISDVSEIPDESDHLSKSMDFHTVGGNRYYAPKVEPECQGHDYVNVSFTGIRMACRHCGRDQ